ncbi:phosphate signaling complex protein PhoU [Rheinheimera salexigens]|uniref:Phosphate-specific transport system accessory protein PhoU n=1 Tax=Rheinheimera salexigens TaxID=1628148 RepID=A0A1E7Q3N0_9GAMM|nr:phosphate signaling complex protein PhoU [Rheinheimera salexigens]OEY68757.1 phosphate transport system regulatory protein PhoU [Rheinheimera salexigens]
MPNSKIGRHYSQAFDTELQQAVDRLLQMAALTQQQLTDAIAAFVEADHARAEQVVASDHRVNDFEVDIDEHCLDILARRQPAASDLRLVLTVLKSINDIERIGDLAKRVAKTLLEQADTDRPNQAQLDEIDVMGHRVLHMLQRACVSFERMDATDALTVLRKDKEIDQDYDRIVAQSISAMSNDSSQVGPSMQLFVIARALERIGDHSRNICQHVIFLCKGRNVAHFSDAELQQIVDKQRS